MLSQNDLSQIDLGSSSAEESADTFFEIGSDQSRKLQWSEAVYWFHRAHEAISDRKPSELSPDSEALRIAILHGLARARLNQPSGEGQAIAGDIIRKLDVECGDRLFVLLLKLDVFALNPCHAPQDYHDVLQAIVHTVNLKEANVKIVLRHMHKLRTRSPDMVHEILLTLLMERCKSAEKPEWTERIFVTLIWNSTTSAENPKVLSLLSAMLDTFASNTNQMLSPPAIHAAQIVSLL